MSKRFRLLVVLALVGVSIFFIYPTIQWYFLIPEEMKALAANTRQQVRETSRDEAREALSVLGALAEDSEERPLPSEYEFIVEPAKTNFRLEQREIPDQWTVGQILSAFRSGEEAFAAFEEHYAAEIFALKDLKDRIITLGLDLAGGMSVVVEADEVSLAERLGREPTGEEIEEAIDLAVTILTSRIDQFGVTEPQIRRQEGSNRILIEVPGDNDRSRIESYLQGKGSLEFHIVDDEATAAIIALQQEQPGWDLSAFGTPDFIPVGTSVASYVVPDEYGILGLVRYIAIKDDITDFGLPGEHITEARVGQQQLTNRPTVNFVLDRGGSDIFSNLIRNNIGGSLAILLDGKVRTYARINEEIPSGQVQITGFDLEEANNIATVLRTAALPVDLNIVTQQAVGATMGSDSVRSGLRAIAVGFGLVILFMLLYYWGAGLIADLALILNLFFIISILSVFNLTLTLTSIAGLILTVGIAVDANVIIFERIKEEYRLGKSPQAAVKAGFQKAFWTIMDANITTFIAALFLSQLSSGPIQGFAITLAVGIVSSMFTSLFLSRLIYDFGTEVLRRSRLSLGWGAR